MVRKWYLRPCSQLAACKWACGEVNPLLRAGHPYLLPGCAADYESAASSIAHRPHNIHQELFDFAVTYRRTNDLYRRDPRRRASGFRRVEFAL
jgi:hypothetical protein